LLKLYLLSCYFIVGLRANRRPYPKLE